MQQVLHCLISYRISHIIALYVDIQTNNKDWTVQLKD